MSDEQTKTEGQDEQADAGIKELEASVEAEANRELSPEEQEQNRQAMRDWWLACLDGLLQHPRFVGFVQANYEITPVIDHEKQAVTVHIKERQSPIYPDMTEARINALATVLTMHKVRGRHVGRAISSILRIMRAGVRGVTERPAGVNLPVGNLMDPPPMTEEKKEPRSDDDPSRTMCACGHMAGLHGEEDLSGRCLAVQCSCRQFVAVHAVDCDMDEDCTCDAQQDKDPENLQ